MREITKDAVADEVTYIYLIEDVEPASRPTAAQRKKEMSDINNFVRKEGGKCRLYHTAGGAADYVSVISGVSAASAIRIAAEIEKRGAAKATLISGIEVFSTP